MHQFSKRRLAWEGRSGEQNVPNWLRAFGAIQNALYESIVGAKVGQAKAFESCLQIGMTVRSSISQDSECSQHGTVHLLGFTPRVAVVHQ